MLSTALAVLVVAPAATAQQVAKATPPLWESAPNFQQLVVPGAQVRTATSRLLGKMNWHRRLEQAVAEAKAENKPIVWVQALGELRGLT